MSHRIIGQTKRCIVCRKPACEWGGHVRLPAGDTVIAGFCSPKCGRIVRAPGYFGVFFKWMGVEPT